MQLYNKLSAKERETLIDEAGEDRLTLSFYAYAKIGNPHLFRNHLFEKSSRWGPIFACLPVNGSLKIRWSYDTKERDQ